MRKYILLCTAFIACTILSYAQTETKDGIVFMDNPKWETVIERAKTEKKLIFLDCYTTWCGPCKGLAKSTFPNKDVGDFFNPQFICVKMDMEKGDGKILREKYKQNIPGFPTMLFIDADGNIKHFIVGFKEPDELIRGAKMGLEGKTVSSLKKRYDAGERSYEFITDYLEVLNVAFMKDEMSAVVFDYISFLPQDSIKEKRNIELYTPYIISTQNPKIDYVINNLTHYTHRLKNFDRYELVDKLNYALDRDVRNIVSLKKDKDNNFLPLIVNETEVNRLTNLMSKFSFENAEQHRAKLYIHNQLINENWAEVVNALEYANKMNVLGFADSYIATNASYIMTKTKDKKILKHLLTILKTKTDSYDERQKTQNYYIFEPLANLYKQIGDKKNEAIYREIYDTEYKKIQERYKDFLKNDK